MSTVEALRIRSTDSALESLRADYRRRIQAEEKRVQELREEAAGWSLQLAQSTSPSDRVSIMHGYEGAVRQALTACVRIECLHDALHALGIVRGNGVGARS